MKLFAVLFAAVLSVGASHAAGETQAVSPAQKVTSKDGALTVSVPRGALTKNVKVSIRVLLRAQYPPELRSSQLSPGSRLYALEPAGTTFLKPVTVTNRVNARLQGFDLSAVPGIVLTTRSGTGRWEILKGQTVRPSGTTLVISGTTRHFSTLVGFDSGARVSLAPSFVQTQVGSTWQASVSLEFEGRIQRDRVVLRSPQWAADDEVVSLQRKEGSGAVFSCARAGNGQFGSSVILASDSLVAPAGSLGRQSYTQKFQLGGTAECKAPAAHG